MITIAPLLLRMARRYGAPLALATLVVACGQKQQQAHAPPPQAVTVAHPTKRTIVDHDEYVGRFVAVNSVEVRARVSGYLEGVHFKDGQMVKQGDLLFTIDKRPFANAVQQAQATLAQAQSNLEYAEADLQRGQQLVKEKTITTQIFEQRAQAARNARAALTGAEAALRTAKLDLEFTELRAPIDGRIGDRRVSPGNLVTGGSGGSTTLLATIVSTNPIHFEFTFDEAAFLRYEQMSEHGHDVESRKASLPVSLKLINEEGFPHQGHMDFVDNVINSSTGTIRARAIFDNSSGLFIPGMFARVRVPASAPYQALLVPDSAIGSEQARKYVMTVNDKNVAEEKYVTLGQLVGGLRVIKSGLDPQDRLIVAGLARVRAGQTVKPEEKQDTSGKPTASAKPSPRSKMD
jgi:RND family efflux transporter MFP subunit